MTDRERMIEVIEKYGNDKEVENLFYHSANIADRLIEAGFGVVNKKADKSLCPACVHNGTEGCSDWKYAPPIQKCSDYTRKP